MTDQPAEGRKCFACSKPDTETVLLTIILPPTIMERQELCPPCLAIAIDASKTKTKNKGKAAQR